MPFLDWLRRLSRLGRKPLTREKAAELIDEFAEMKWDYSEAFDMAFGDLFDNHDPLLESVAKEFLEIQADYEQNARTNKGALSKENLTRLRKLSTKLRSSLDEPSVS